MAAGKNAVSDILCAKGFVSVDADKLVHIAIDTPSVSSQILQTFSKEAEEHGVNLQVEGHIDRRALGSLIFKSPELIKKQEDIVYPQVIRLTDDFIEQNKDKDKIINATVLYKIPYIMQKIDKVLYVDAPLILRYMRAKKRDGFSTVQILRRFYAQKNLFSKYESYCADILRVWNTGSRKRLENKINKFLAIR